MVLPLLSVYIRCGMSFVFLQHHPTIFQHHEMSHWCFNRKHSLNSSFHCDQITEQRLTEWGWRVAYSTIERSQKAVQAEIFIWHSVKPGLTFLPEFFSLSGQSTTLKRGQLALADLVDQRTRTAPYLQLEIRKKTKKIDTRGHLYSQWGQVILPGFLCRGPEVRPAAVESGILFWWSHCN